MGNPYDLNYSSIPPTTPTGGTLFDSMKGLTLPLDSLNTGNTPSTSWYSNALNSLFSKDSNYSGVAKGFGSLLSGLSSYLNTQGANKFADAQMKFMDTNLANSTTLKNNMLAGQYASNMAYYGHPLQGAQYSLGGNGVIGNGTQAPAQPAPIAQKPQPNNYQSIYG